jgi:Lytic polysaccharide mono-oxygenase, cellulose-degrading
LSNDDDILVFFHVDPLNNSSDFGEVSWIYQITKVRNYYKGGKQNNHWIFFLKYLYPTPDRSRSYIAWEEGVWSGGGSKTYPKEDCPQCANIGGTAGQCGVIGGRNYDKNLNVLGKPLPPNPQSRYRRGEVIEIDVVLTAHHMGHFEFSACPIKAGGIAKGSCFDKYRLKFVKDPLYGATKDPDYPYRAYLSPASYAKRDSDDRGLLYRFQMKLPDNLTGDLVLLQWHYYTSNSCTYPGYSKYSFPSKWGNINTGQGICKNIPSDGRGLPGKDISYFHNTLTLLCVRSL